MKKVLKTIRSQAPKVLKTESHKNHKVLKTVGRKNRKVLIIIGPTGIGKSSLALEVAAKFGTEIINADSRQIYQEFDIGTGKEVDYLKKGLAQKFSGYWVVNNIKVNLYDFYKPTEISNVAKYQKLALDLIQKLHSENKLPILVGGSGLYVSSVVENYQFPKNPGMQFTKNPKANYDFLIIGLTQERQSLYAKVDQRVLDWLDLGLVEEVQGIIAKYPADKIRAMNGLIYKSVWAYLTNKMSKGEMVARIQFDQHSYIRRQYTWFNKMDNVKWFDITKDKRAIWNQIESWYPKEELAKLNQLITNAK